MLPQEIWFLGMLFLEIYPAASPEETFYVKYSNEVRDQSFTLLTLICSTEPFILHSKKSTEETWLVQSTRKGVAYIATASSRG